MTNVLYTSSHHVGKAMDQARQLVALANEFGNVTIHVRPVAEIDALKRQVATLAKALREIAEDAGPSAERTIALAALKAAGVEP